MNNLLVIFLFFLFFVLVLTYPIYRMTRTSDDKTSFKRALAVVSVTCFIIFSIVYLILEFGPGFGFLYFALLIVGLVFTIIRTKRHPTVFKHHFKDYQFFYNERDEILVRAISWGRIGYSLQVTEDGSVIFLYINELVRSNHILCISQEEHPHQIIARFDSILAFAGVSLSYTPKPIREDFAGKATINCINHIAKTLRNQGMEVINFPNLGFPYSLGIIPVDRLYEIREFLIKG